MLTDTRFYNRNLYPNLLRMRNEVTGEHFATLLKWMGVKRVAIISGPNFSSGPTLRYITENFHSAFRKASIGVITSIQTLFTVSKNDTTQLDNVFQELKRVDARYIVILADPVTTADIYFNGAKNYGYISSKHVWLSLNYPADKDNRNFSLAYYPEAYHDLNGLIFPLINYAPFNSSNFNNQWLSLSKLQPERFISQGYVSPRSYNAYDCTMILLHGLDQVSFSCNKLLTF
jgi:hypothetical protein